MTNAEFVLKAATEAGIKLGTDGTELIIAMPPKMPRESRRSFDRAILAYHREIIELILAEGKP